MIRTVDYSNWNSPYNLRIFDWPMISGGYERMREKGLLGLGASGSGETDTTVLQRTVGAAPSGQWNTATESALAAWQRAHHIAPTANPDPITLTAMQVYDPVSGAPRSFQRSLESGETPGHFGRDLATAMNQLPRWSWVLMGVGFGGLAYLSWRKRGRGE